MSALAKNLALIAAAIVTKLSGSVDDVVWLMPFLSPTGKTNTKRLCMAETYIMVMCLVTTCAIAISIGGEMLFELIFGDDDAYWNAQRVLSLASGIILSLYTIYLFYEWWNERSEDDAETVDVMDPSASSQSPSDLKTKSNAETAGDNPDDTEMHELNPDEPDASVEVYGVKDTAKETEDADDINTSKLTVGRLVIVAIAGSLDDFAVQCALLLAETFLWYQLLIGVFIGTLIVVFICFCISYVHCVVKYIEKVPIWVIIGALAIYTIVSAFYSIE